MDSALWSTPDVSAYGACPVECVAERSVDTGALDVDSSLERFNRELDDAPARAIVRRTLALAERPMLSSSFGPDSAALIHLVHQVRRDVPVVWIDTGYHTRATHRFVESLTRERDLDLRIYRPALARRDIEELVGGVPMAGTQAHARFAELVKLEPFRRALQELAPDVWLTGLRAEETEHRRALPTVSRGPNGVLKVAPLRRWDQARTAGFLHAHDLPNGHDYHDAVKGGTRLECGLHDRL